jgi:hypothetical protein
MVEEVLERQTKAMVVQTGQPFDTAMVSVARTHAGQRLQELAESEHRDELAAYWQANLPRRRAEERHYSWLEGYLGWLDGKEARAEYHKLLEAELSGLKRCAGSPSPSGR